jgi:hypothetical protein
MFHCIRRRAFQHRREKPAYGPGVPVPLHFERLIMPAAAAFNETRSCAARRSLLAKRTNRKDGRAEMQRALSSGSTRNRRRGAAFCPLSKEGNCYALISASFSDFVG